MSTVVIVGAGPAGLTAAAHLATRIDGEVVVLDREAEAGGIPRHSDHLGYGIRDLRRFVSGPAYAARLAERARQAGAVIHTDTMVTGWAGDHSLEITSPRGRATLSADAIVLATGARERPRPARLIPGDRPDGVYTTGHLQNLVHLHHRKVGKRAVIIGAELVSWSAVLTLREAGCRTVLMTSTHDHAESYAAFRVPGRLALRVPVARRTRLVRINGKHRVESIEVEDIETGERQTVGCDTVIMSGDWIPDHELVRSAGIDLDPDTLGPRVDTALRTSRPGVFAAGNLNHAVDTADVAALDGLHVATYVHEWLSGARIPHEAVPIVADEPFRWVSPSLLRPGDPAPPRGKLLLWTDEYRRLPHIVATQDGRQIGSVRVAWPAAPGRVFRVPHSLVASADARGGPVHLAHA
ncbi:FAD-dependent oxidoreductase [soil metagenome]